MQHLDPYNLPEHSAREVVEIAEQLSPPLRTEFFQAADPAALTAGLAHIQAGLVQMESFTQECSTLKAWKNQWKSEIELLRLLSKANLTGPMALLFCRQLLEKSFQRSFN
ncbi:MAG: hypothetical protein WA705_05645 [Candidatus Ozemobacteraceae bacterium]